LTPSPAYFFDAGTAETEQAGTAPSGTRAGAPFRSKNIRCGLCPRNCIVPSGQFGACGVRGNKNGKGLIPFYGMITALALDPIEKKPLYHFRPGANILSVGFAGCNLRCPFCQNWHISQIKSLGSDVSHNDGLSGRYMTPAELVSAALRESAFEDRGDPPNLAYTYSEPLVHAEYLLDCMALARKQGIANVLVSNGCAMKEAASDILSLTDAANIDLKSFSADTYSEVLGGNLTTVLDFIKLAVQKGVHLEITTLVVPELNDSPEELDQCADFIAGLSRDGDGMGIIPWHLSAYHPEYRWNAPPTDAALLLKTAERARKKLRYVYAGNIAGEENKTVCPSCAAVLVRRRGYRIDSSGLQQTGERDKKRYVCAKCGENAPFSC
jgi:pyruvate formate lyase activating enzyme